MYAVNISAKFELRSLMRSWDNRGYCKNLRSPWVRPRILFSQIFNGILVACTLWIYLPNLKFVALRVPEIIGRTGKIWAVPGYAHAPFPPKFLTAFGRINAVNIRAKFEVCSSTSSWDNKEYWKNLGRPWIRPRSLYSQMFKRLLFACTLWIYLPNLSFVA